MVNNVRHLESEGVSLLLLNGSGIFSPAPNETDDAHEVFGGDAVSQ